MDLRQLLFRFQGRTPRLRWWIASIAVALMAGVVSSLLELAAKSSGSSILNPETNAFEPTGLFGVALFAVGLANVWINFALCAKRLHDRDRTAWWLAAQIVGLLLFATVLVIAISVPQEQAATWFVAAGAIGVIVFGLTLWLFVEMGFLRGTQGPNRFGPDPLGALNADATL
jgi:uncharacterized membrane protein YhaH (DUF805 family)